MLASEDNSVTEGAIEERPSLSFHLLAFAGAFRRVDMNHEVVASELLNLRIFVTLRHKSRRYGVKVSQMKIRFHETLQKQTGEDQQRISKNPEKFWITTYTIHDR